MTTPAVTLGPNNSGFRGRRLAALCWWASIALAWSLPNEAAPQKSRALADLSLEELASLPITSVSRQSQPLSSAPASIYVIREDDISHSGATTLPQVLRRAPNVHVARVDARNYAISSRGFNSAFANKLLVLIDGRTVYSPLYSGVFWDAQDVFLEDIDRIEVISGPGATMWGANAVNGVINVRSKTASRTQGGLFSLGGSNKESGIAARYGGRLPGGHYRVYARHLEQDDFYRAGGEPSVSGMDRSQVGFRADWERPQDAFTLQGDVYDGDLEYRAGPGTMSGANLLGRYTRELETGSQLATQIYFDHTQRHQPGAATQHLNLFDVEAQYDDRLSEGHRLIFGGGWRYASDNITNDVGLAFKPNEVTLHWANVFAQDVLALTDDVDLTLGLKFEYNSYTEWETLPSLRLAWQPEEHRLLWGAVSRAVRAPARLDRELFLPAAPEVIDGEPQWILAGGPDFISEDVTVLEVGYRSQPMKHVTWSSSIYYADYASLRSVRPNPKGAGVIYTNSGAAESYGLELWGSLQATPSWRLQAGLVLQDVEKEFEQNAADLALNSIFTEDDPNIYVKLISSYDVTEEVHLELAGRYVGEMSKTDAPDYTELDMGVSWQMLPQVSVSLTGRNLLNDEHVEWVRASGSVEIPRTIVWKLIWRI